MASFKVLVVEIDGTELDYSTEKDLAEMLKTLGGGAFDFHSGFSIVEDGEAITINDLKQMTNFTALSIDGDLILDGDLWLA